MEIDFRTLRGREIYAWMTGLIVPRPIAWVSTRSKDGVNNLAPFSYFNAVGTRPPALMFCPANRRDGSEKDTLVNIRQTGEFVVNMVTESVVGQMNATAAEVTPDVDEFEWADIDAVASTQVSAPRVRSAMASMECRLHQITSLASGPGAANIVIGIIENLVVDDALLDDRGKFDSGNFDAVGRMSGDTYCRTMDRFDRNQ